MGPVHRRVRHQRRRRQRQPARDAERRRLHDEHGEELGPGEDGKLRAAAREHQRPRLAGEHDSLRQQPRVRARDVLREQAVRREPARRQSCGHGRLSTGRSQADHGARRRGDAQHGGGVQGRRHRTRRQAGVRS